MTQPFDVEECEDWSVDFAQGVIIRNIEGCIFYVICMLLFSFECNVFRLLHLRSQCLAAQQFSPCEIIMMTLSLEVWRVLEYKFICSW